MRTMAFFRRTGRFCAGLAATLAWMAAPTPGSVRSAGAAETFQSPMPLTEIDVGGGNAHDAWHLGALLSRSGSGQSKGTASMEGASQALRALNAAGGFRGKKFRLFITDDYSRDDAAVAGAWTFAHDDRFLAVIGPQTSDIAQTVIREVLSRKAGLVFVSPTVTRDGLVTPEGWFFSGLWPDSAQARVMATYLWREAGRKKGVVVIDPRSLYSVGLSGHFREAFQALGGQVAQIRIDNRARPELPQEAFPPILAEVLATRPEFVYVPMTAGNIRNFVRQAFRSNVGADILLCGGDTWDNTEIFQTAGRRLEGCLLTSPFYPNDPSERVRNFTRQMNLANVLSVSLDTVMGHDVVTMLVAAMEQGGPTREGIREGWFKLRDLPLVSGDTSVEASGHTRKPVLILKAAAHPTGYITELVKRMDLE